MGCSGWKGWDDGDGDVGVDGVAPDGHVRQLLSFCLGIKVTSVMSG